MFEKKLIACIEAGNESLPGWLSLCMGLGLCSPNAQTGYIAETSALLLALKEKKQAIACSLIEKGADIGTTGDRGQTALIMACQNGLEQAVKRLIDRSADPNMADNQGITPLMSACKKGHDKIAAQLLKYGADINLKDSKNNTALMFAASQQNTDLIALLIENGAEINAKNQNGHTSLQRAVKQKHSKIIKMLIPGITNPDEIKQALFHAINSGTTKIVKLVLDDSSLLADSPESLQEALVKTIKSGLRPAAELLIDKGADVNGTNKQGNPPLFEALNHSRENMIELLLEKGADANFKNDHNRTALHMAVERQLTESVRALISAGADLQAVDDQGDTALQLSAVSGNVDMVDLLVTSGADINTPGRFKRTPLLAAVFNDHTAVAQLLVERGADVNATAMDDGETALLMAIDYNDASLVSLLIENGANVNTRDKFGKTPLMESCRLADVRIADLLIQSGADVTIADESGRTALLEAVSTGSLEIAEMLLGKGADVHAEDEKGRTAISIAADEKDQDMIRLLAGHGADTDGIALPPENPVDTIIKHLHQEEEERGWGEVIDLQRATSRYMNRPDQARDVNELCSQLIKKNPDFDLPRLWHVTSLFDLGKKDEAISSMLEGIASCKRKSEIFGCFAQDMFWNDCVESQEDFILLFAAATAAFKLGSGIYFSQCFLADYFDFHGLYDDDLVRELRNCPASFDDTSRRKVLDLVTSYSPDDDILSIANAHFGPSSGSEPSGNKESYRDKLLIVGCGFMPEMDDMLALAASGKAPWPAESAIPFIMKLAPDNEAETLEMADLLLTSPEPLGCGLAKGDYESLMVEVEGKRMVVACVQ